MLCLDRVSSCAKNAFCMVFADNAAMGARRRSSCGGGFSAGGEHEEKKVDELS